MIEKWKPVKDCENYEVSNQGRVRKRKDKLIIKGHLHKGNMNVYIKKPSGHKTTREIGKLVLTAFDEYKPLSKYSAKHIDGDPANNRLENLKWEPHSKRIGKIIYLKKPGEKHKFRTLKNAAKFLKICSSSATLVKVEQVAKKRGWDFSTQVDDEAYLDEERFGPTAYDEKHISSVAVKQQIRDEVNKFVSYCDTHYSTCNEIERKGCIDKIDESDPVVIKFRKFLKEHNV